MTEEEEEKKHNKFMSRRFWLACWAGAAITGIIIGSYVRNNYEMTGVAIALVAVVTAYVGMESYNKRFTIGGKE